MKLTVADWLCIVIVVVGAIDIYVYEVHRKFMKAQIVINAAQSKFNDYWVSIIRGIEGQHDNLHRRMVTVEEGHHWVKQLTTIGVDIGFHPGGDNNWAIMVGKYKGRDYVQTFAMNGEDFRHVLDQLKALSKHGMVRMVDAPPGFKAVIESTL